LSIQLSNSETKADKLLIDNSGFVTTNGNRFFDEIEKEEKDDDE